MALREFVDEMGCEWRVWDVTPESLHPLVRGAAHLRPFEGGWLVFESADGRVKHRLTPIPAEWGRADDDQLRCWLTAAVGGDGSAPGEGSEAPCPPHGEARAARTFRFPGGRYWTVSECTLPDRRFGAAAVRRVLRFSAGARSLDRASWPTDWRYYSDAELAELLASGFPRGAPAADGSAPRRRASDGVRVRTD